MFLIVSKVVRVRPSALFFLQNIENSGCILITRNNLPERRCLYFSSCLGIWAGQRCPTTCIYTLSKKEKIAWFTEATKKYFNAKLWMFKQKKFGFPCYVFWHLLVQNQGESNGTTQTMAMFLLLLELGLCCLWLHKWYLKPKCFNLSTGFQPDLSNCEHPLNIVFMGVYWQICLLEDKKKNMN